MALATVVNIEGSSYRRIGARMLVLDNGIWTGGISGGCLEGDALQKAQKAISSGKPSVVTYDTQEEDSEQIGVGLGCRGRIDVLFMPIPQEGMLELEELRTACDARTCSVLVKVIGEGSELALGSILSDPGDYEDVLPGHRKYIEEALATERSIVYTKGDLRVVYECLRPEMRLVIYGDNYDIYAISDAGSALGWQVEVYGLTRKLRKLFASPPHTIAERSSIVDLSVDRYTAIVLMSHDYDADMRVLEVLLSKHPGYLGILGPRKRLTRMDEDRKTEESLLDYDFLYNPIGLDIGAENPDEIAIAVCAEVISVFRNRAGGHLRSRPGPIHVS